MHTPLVLLDNYKQTFLSILFIAARVCLGCVFIVSAYTKLFPIEYFEYQLVGSHLVSWTVAPFFSRLIIGFEFFIGTSFIVNIDYKKLVVKCTALVISIFSVYIVYRLFAFGNESNCSCFGDVVVISNASSLVKNIIILLLLLVLWKYHHGWTYRYPKMIISLLGIASFVTMFIVNPVNKEFVVRADMSAVNYPLNLDFLYQNPQYKTPAVDVRKGKHIIAFLSMSCPHCKLAALKLGIMKRNTPALPIYFILNGDSNDLKKFYTYTNAQHVPSSIVLGERFTNLAGFNLPAIVWIENAMVIKKSLYVDLTESDIMQWDKAKQ